MSLKCNIDTICSNWLWDKFASAMNLDNVEGYQHRCLFGDYSMSLYNIISNTFFTLSISTGGTIPLALAEVVLYIFVCKTICSKNSLLKNKERNDMGLLQECNGSVSSQLSCNFFSSNWEYAGISHSRSICEFNINFSVWLVWFFFISSGLTFFWAFF